MSAISWIVQADCATNNFTLSAKTIADIYQQRWQVESFFKRLP